jgi:hypothetical protein
VSLSFNSIIHEKNPFGIAGMIIIQVSVLFAIVYHSPMVEVKASGAIIYVDKDSACPENGSSATPFCSITNAMNVAVAGDTIRIRDSATPYDEQVFAKNSGMASSPIILEPDVGHHPILPCSITNSSYGIVNIENVDYWTIRNLTFDAPGLATSCKDAIRVAARTRDTTGVVVDGNTFNMWGGTDQGGPNGVGNNILGAQAIALSGDYGSANKYTTVTVTNNTITAAKENAIGLTHTRDSMIENNTIDGTRCGTHTAGYYPEAIGIKLVYTNVRTIIRGNTVRNTQTASACNSAIPNHGFTWVTQGGIYCDVGDDSAIVERHMVFNILSGGYSSDTAGIFWEAGGCNNAIIRNNVIYNVSSLAIKLAGPSGTACDHNVGNQVLNNTVQSNGGGNNAGIGLLGQVKNATVRNNISYVNNSSGVAISVDSTPIAYGGHTINNNLYYNSASASSVGKWAAARSASAHGNRPIIVTLILSIPIPNSSPTSQICDCNRHLWPLTPAQPRPPWSTTFSGFCALRVPLMTSVRMSTVGWLQLPPPPQLQLRARPPFPSPAASKPSRTVQAVKV